MRILMVNDFKGIAGGTEVYVQGIKEELEKKGHTVKIFSGDLSFNNFQYKKSLSKLLSLLFNVKYLNKFWIKFKEFNPDVIHVHNMFYELSPSFLLLTKNIPVIITVHDNQLVNPVSILSGRTGRECKKRTCGGCMNCIGWKGTIYEYIKRNIHKFLFNKIDLFITPSQYMGILIQEAGFHPVMTIPNGIKLLSYSKMHNFNKPLYVGRFVKDKGIEFLFRAMPEIIEKFPYVELTLVGDGPDRDYFLKLAEELKIKKNIRFVGLVASEDIENYYSDSTIVILPSIHDNFPTVCIETMSVGRPIIGSRVGGIPELVDDGKTGCLVDPGNSEQIAERVIQLLSNRKLLEQMGKNARKKAEQFSIEKHVDKIEKIYSEVIKKYKTKEAF